MKSKAMRIVCLALVLMVVGSMTLAAQATIRDLGRPPRALAGMNIVVGNYWTDYDTTKNPPTAQWRGSESEEKQLEWRKQIQQQFNFKMQDKNIASWNEMPQVAATSIMAGRPAATVFVVQSDWAMSLYRQDLLANVGTSRAIDFTTRNKIVEVNQMINSLFTFRGRGGGTYALQFGYGGSLHGQVIFFNKRLFREAGLDPNLPYDLQKSGRWTWDEFLRICKALTRDNNNDGIMDTYAMTADLSTEILDIFVAGNNADYVGRDREGRLVNATGTPQFLQALQFAIRLQREGVMMPKPEGAAWDWYKPMFNDGRVAMRLEQEYVRNDLANMRDDWGVVVPPRGPNSPRNYVILTDENVMVIPKTFNRDQVDAILWALQAWNATLDARWQTALYPVFRDVRAVDETMALIRDPQLQKFRNNILVPGLNRGTIAWEMWWFDGEPAQLIESVSQSWNMRIQDANEQ